jgi:hypothetical protein
MLLWKGIANQVRQYSTKRIEVIRTGTIWAFEKVVFLDMLVIYQNHDSEFPRIWFLFHIVYIVFRAQPHEYI